MRRRQNIILYLSGLILLLHAFIPHQHHDQLGFRGDVIEHAKAIDVSDFISLAFHEDPGERHLQDFNPDHGYFMLAMPASDFIRAEIIQPEIHEPEIPAYTAYSPPLAEASGYKSSWRFRPPPVS